MKNTMSITEAHYFLLKKVEAMTCYKRFNIYSLLGDDIHNIAVKDRSAVSYHFNNSMYSMREILIIPNTKKGPITYMKVPTNFVNALQIKVDTTFKYSSTTIPIELNLREDIDCGIFSHTIEEVTYNE